MKLRPRERKNRDDGLGDCPYCREPSDVGAPRCPSCRTPVHLECLGELTRCSSLGCPVLPRDFVLEDGSRPALDRLSGGSPRWKLALRRSLPLGVALSLVLLTPGLVGRAHAWQLAGLMLMGLVFGLVTLPGSWVEFREAGRKPLWGRHLVGAAGSALVASAIAACAFGIGRVVELLGHGASWARIARTGTELWERLLANPDMGNAVVLAGGTLGLVTLLRLRGLPLLKQVGLTLLAAAVLAGTLALLNPMRGFGRTLFWVMTGVGALLLPTTSWLLEWLPWPAWLRRPRRPGHPAKQADPSLGDPAP